MSTDARRIQDVFLTAVEIDNPAERTEFLDRSCDGNAGLRNRVEALLRAHDQPDSLLDQPAVAAPDSGSEDDRTIGHESGTAPDDEVPLGFLKPATRPESLGRIGHYEVLEVLGQGGFGIVFRAFDDVLQRVVAVKVLAPQLAATSPARKRFLREAQSSAKVRHDNVVQVYEVGEQPLPYIAMEFIPGETLQQRLNRVGPVDAAEVVRIGRQIAEGLAAAHATDLIHRDIKPGNILLEGGQQKVKITDFGLARAADDASISQSGIIAGTPMYMAPEQAKGEKLDRRADLFSLGSVLYQMAAGRPPFRAPSTLAVLKRVAEEPARPLAEIIPETPDWLCGIIAKLHAKHPEDRFQSAREVADLLADCEAKLKAKQEATIAVPGAPSRVSGRVECPRASAGPKWLAAAAVLVLPLLVLAVTEFAGMTQLFQAQPTTNPVNPGRVPTPNEIGAQQTTTDPIKPGRDSTLNQVSKPDVPKSDGWVQLFNGKDLIGWEAHPQQPGDWRVENGVLVGRGPKASHLFSERADWRDFHLRVETRLTERGQSSVLVRSSFGLPFRVGDKGLPSGYAVNFLGDGPSVRAGELHELGRHLGPKPLLARVAIAPGTWFTMEIITQGERYVVKVNGETTADYRDPDRQFSTGRLALQVWNADTIVQFRKVEIKELPANSLPLAVAPFDAVKAKEHQEAWAKHLGVPVETTNSIGMKLRLIPPGQFLMGSPEDEVGREAQEGPEHEVVISRPFRMGIHDVTVGQFKAFVTEKGYKTQAEKNGGAWRPYPDGFWKQDAQVNWQVPNFEQTDDHPVVCVSWNDAKAFCDWLCEKEGTKYGLPTEAQWEFACRAGSNTKFYFGDDDDQLGEYGWYRANSKGQPNPVGQKKPNAWGLYDLEGNVCQWTADWRRSDYYRKSPKEDPLGPTAGGTRAVRGSNWWDGARFARAAFRHGSDFWLPWKGCTGTGFRVVEVGDLKAKTPPLLSADAIRQGRYLAPDLSRAKPLYEDRFQDPASGWTKNKGNYYEVGYQDGRYFMAVSARFIRVQHCSARPAGDFACEIVGRIAGIPNASWCLDIQNQQRKRSLIMRVTGKQEVEIYTRDHQTQKTTQLHLIQHPAIKPGTEFNRMLVIGRGQSFEIYANGVLICPPVSTDFITMPATCALAVIAESLDCRADFERVTIWDADGLPAFRLVPMEIAPPVAPQELLPPTHKNSLGMEFVIVPKGKSWLGGGKDKPGHKEVEMAAEFYLGKHEVTQEEWEKVMGENPSHFSRTGPGKDVVMDVADADLKRFPVESVSWDQCQIFIAKLNNLERETGWTYRLPKEVEWEYACRGGPMADKRDSAFDFYFAKPTNALMPKQANFDPGEGLKRSCKVGTHEANPLGIFDMHGNVWEWCDDTLRGSDGASLRAYRGGSWLLEAGDCRAAHRIEQSPQLQDFRLGLRVARVPSGAAASAAKTPPSSSLRCPGARAVCAAFHHLGGS